MYFISQLGKHDCAFACLKMMLANYHRDKNYLYLQCPEDRPYSFLELIKIAGIYDLKLLGVKVTDPKELYSCKKFPFIITLERKKGIKHAVLILKANPKYVTVYDPSVGKHRISTEIFLDEWNGRALIAEEEPKKKKCEIIYPDFVDTRDKIILPILQVISGISLLLGAYFVSDKTIYFLPIAFFALFVIFEIIFRWQLVNAMKRMDDNIYEYDFRRENLNYLELYKTIENYRYHALSTTPNFIGATLIAAFVSIITVINDSLNMIYIFLPLALAVIDVFFYKPYFKNKSIEIIEKENEVVEVETDFQFKTKSRDAHDVAYQIGFNKNTYTYLEVAVILLTIVLMMMITRVINITYVLVYLCISIFLKQTFTKMLEYSLQSEEFEKTKARLINQIDFKL